MRNNYKITFLICLLLITIFVGGCQTRTPQKPNIESKNNMNNKKIENKMAKDIRGNDDIMDNDINNTRVDDGRIRNKTTNINNRADRIARKIADLNEVNNATVVITGNTALVGVDIKSNLEGKMTDNLKRKVERTVKNSDNKIQTVAITADADIYKRISNMAKDVGNGKPISGFAKEIQEILRRISPGK